MVPLTLQRYPIVLKWSNRKEWKGYSALQSFCVHNISLTSSDCVSCLLSDQQTFHLRKIKEEKLSQMISDRTVRYWSTSHTCAPHPVECWRGQECMDTTMRNYSALRLQKKSISTPDFQMMSFSKFVNFWFGILPGLCPCTYDHPSSSPLCLIFMFPCQVSYQCPMRCSDHRMMQRVKSWRILIFSRELSRRLWNCE